MMFNEIVLIYFLIELMQLTSTTSRLERVGAVKSRDDRSRVMTTHHERLRVALGTDRTDFFKVCKIYILSTPVD